MRNENAMPIKLASSLPQPAYDASEVLQNEAAIAAEEGIAMYQLMECAGSAIFRQMQVSFFHTKSLLVVCGKGNNGGDGFVVARLAAATGIAVTVLIAAELDAIKGDAATALMHLKATNIKIISTQSPALMLNTVKQFAGELIIDCLFGIGFKGTLNRQLCDLIQQMNDHSAPILSVDIPSGLAANTGHVEQIAVIATITVTFIVVKQGLLTGQAANYIGALYLADLGIGTRFIKQVPTTILVQGYQGMAKFSQRRPASHKGDIGLLLAIGGNKGMPGAIRLSAEAALRAGMSLVAVCCHKKSKALVFHGRPEIMLTPSQADKLAEFAAVKKVKVLIVGPGLGRNKWAQQLFSFAIKQSQPCIVDADALYLLSCAPHFRKNWVLTPHPGEAASLLRCSVADIEADRFSAVRHIARHYGGICVLKGAGTLISDGDIVWINTSGNSGMASGGMGDVLSGIIAAMLVQWSEPIEAVRYAVFIHGHGADILAEQNGQRGILASDLFPQIQQQINS